MIYRESGQFKTNYKADQAILPIFQDKIAMALLMLFAFVVIPFIADDYWLSSILIPYRLRIIFTPIGSIFITNRLRTIFTTI